MKVIVNNLAVEYEDEGEGTSILLLHGWQHSKESFDPLSKELGKSFRIVRLDLPGFGQSEIPRGDWSVEDYARFVASFLKKLDIVPHAILGHSLGGRIAIKGAGEGILKTSRLVLIAAPGVKERTAGRMFLWMIVAKIGDAIFSVPILRKAKSKVRGNFYRFLKSDYAEAGGLSGTFKKLVAENLRSSAAAINVPTLIIWGALDDVVGMGEGSRLHDLIKGSRLEVIKGAGHNVHQTNAAKVAAMIKSFI